MKILDVTAERERYAKMMEFERKFYTEGAKYIAGVDEAGRGPLAGPLTIAAVVLPKEAFIPGLNDSKKLTAKKRDVLYDEILKVAISASINIVSVSNIDKLNIYNATKFGMAECLEYLSVKPQVALIDAMQPNVTDMKIIPIIHGDALSVSIAAASILAKVFRDRIMVRLDQLYPQYGFASHKGYGSAKHMAAIREHGAISWHRRSYEPIKSMNLPPVAETKNICFSPLLEKNFEYKLK